MKLKRVLNIVAVAACIVAASVGGVAHAQDDTAGDFSLQVTPSPIVETIKPGTTTNLELSIRNTGSQKETLKMGLRKFSINKESGEIELSNDQPDEITDWVVFANPVFSIEPGEWFTQKFSVNTPETAGFSYSFAMTISRNESVQPTEGKTALEGTVAVFTLFSVDKPGAERKFEIESFSSSKKLYEFLPTEFTATLKNTGNTIVQPTGTIFISRPGSNDPVATLSVNQTGAYILPDTSRDLTASWVEGFPSYKKVKPADNAPEKSELSWDFSQVQKFRFGKYEAKMVAIYNDGERDIPVTATVEFIVFPWKLAIGAAVIMLILSIGVITIVHKTVRVARRKHDKKTFIEES